MIETSWRYARWGDLERLRAVTPTRVAEYFRGQGWAEYPSTNPQWRYFEHPTEWFDNGERRYYVYPAVDDYSTYPLTVADFLVNLCQDRNISPDDLLRELTAAPARPKRRKKPA